MPPPKKAAALAGGKIAPLFIASIGNPAPTYAHTLHSAGHTLLDAVRDARAFPAWQKDRLHANGLVSRQAEAGVARNFSWVPGIVAPGKKAGGVADGEEDWTLWQSPSLMNVSGKALAQAWGRWKRENREGVLVVLHDELERGLGKVVVRRGGSARGHNGLKSIAAQLPGMHKQRKRHVPNEGVCKGETLTNRFCDMMNAVLSHIFLSTYDVYPNPGHF
ncbi:Peptidyl-tRNA hydrolase [Neofusicoccum parvum]|uniref:Peptidyl-tRNA hydrolase n=1 Tax=Neofusicoccum parvum TaxID=310453 RepID=A0ACB5S892_9PEZI|nr:Peptidyl-tRNA hydrolase [Neofusicoccum parvum]